MTRRTIADWPALRADYVSGQMSLLELSAKHGVSFRAVRHQSERGRWSNERRRVGQRVVATVTAAAVATRASQLTDWNDADLKIAKHMRGQLATRLAQIPMEPDPADPFAHLSALDAIVRGLEATQRIARLALGATTTNSGLSSPDGGAIGVAVVPDMVDFYETLLTLEIQSTD